MACQTCDGSSAVQIKDILRTYERGCPDCAAGEAFERQLAREDAAQRERDMDATGQDQEAFDGVF